MEELYWDKRIPFPTDLPKCEIPYVPKTVCGTDGNDYFNYYDLRCVQETQYGKRVNLQLSHKWRCFIWERYGISNSILCFILVLIGFVLIGWCLRKCRAKRAARKMDKKGQHFETNESILLA